MEARMTDTALAPRLTPEKNAERLSIKERLKALADINRVLRAQTRTCNDGSPVSLRIWHNRLLRRQETTDLLITYHILRGTGKEASHARKVRS
jgi:hypothetical protein